MVVDARVKLSAAVGLITLLLGCPQLARAEGDVKTPVATLAKQCKKRNWRACYNLGMRYQFGNGGVRQDYAAARKLFATACRNRDPFACNGMGRLFEKGHGVAKNMHTALTHYKRACHLKDQFVCAYIGYVHHHGHAGATRNIALAKKYYQGACRAGQKRACAELKRADFRSLAQLRKDGAAAQGALARTLLALGKDLSAAAVKTALVGKPSKPIVTLLFFEWTQQVSASRHTNLQAVAYRFANGVVRWAVLGQTVSGRSTRAMLSQTLNLDKSPLWAAVRFPMNAMRSRNCAAINLAKPRHARGLPSMLRKEINASHRNFAASCKILDKTTGGRWLVGIRALANVVNVAGKPVMLRSSIKIDSAGKMTPRNATLQPL